MDLLVNFPEEFSQVIFAVGELLVALVPAIYDVLKGFDRPLHLMEGHFPFVERDVYFSTHHAANPSQASLMHSSSTMIDGP